MIVREKPNKTLQFLEKLTGLDWYYDFPLINTRLTTCNPDLAYTVMTYNIKTKVFQTEDIRGYSGDWTILQSQEFIDFIIKLHLTNERYVVIKQISGNIVDYTVIDLKDDNPILIGAQKEHAEAKCRFFNANYQDINPTGVAYVGE